MTVSRWLIAALSFAVMFGASAWVVSDSWSATGMPTLSWTAHAAALAVVCIELITRAWKIQASAIAVRLPIHFASALKVCLGGDFAAAITPARSGAEPARFLILGENGMPASGRVIVLFLELFLEMCSLALVCGVLAVLFAGRGASVRGLLALVGGYSTVVLGTGAIGLLLARRNALGPPPAWHVWWDYTPVDGVRFSACCDSCAHRCYRCAPATSDTWSLRLADLSCTSCAKWRCSHSWSF